MKILLSGIAMFACWSAQSQNAFVLTGKLTGKDTGLIYLNYKNAAGVYAKDSVPVKDGNFVFNGKLEGPTEGYIASGADVASMDDPNFTSFFLEPAQMNIKLTMGRFKDAEVTGSKTDDENKELKKLMQPVLDRMKPARMELQEAAKVYDEAVKAKKPEAEIDSLKYKEAAIRDKYDAFQPETEKVNTQFFADHPHSYVTLSQLKFFVNRLSLDSLDMFYAAFSPEMKNSAEGKDIHKQIEQLRGGSPGAIAKNFTATDITGKTLRLADFKGKYVLLDFWASWCVPCRKGNPHLRELYAKYHRSGIEFIGVSDDDDKPELWKKAVAKDQLPWKHVLRGLDWDKIRKNIPNEKDISDKFGIHELPTKILIDRNGKIIGRFDETEEKLDQKLREIFAS